MAQILFFRPDGSEQRSRQYFAPGRFIIDQDTEFWTIDPKQYQPDSIHHIHCGHGCYRDYKVAAIDENTVLLQQL